ncbi:MAG: hypothetical protein HYR86_04780 [Candidatus Rokubacteria bacterium]|nr:hypothetical protein [Candidatus Rokubacteria bacterium]
MNPLEQLLNDEVARLLDRLAGSVPGGCLEAMTDERPALRRRLDEVEAQMAALRASMLEGYGRWQRALEDVENLWAVGAWRSEAEQPAEQAASLAA